MCLSSRSRDGEITLDRVGGPQAQSHVCTLGSQGEVCHTEGERPGDRGGGDPGNVTTSQGMPVSTRSCRKRGRLPRHLEGARPNIQRECRPGIRREHGPDIWREYAPTSGGNTAQASGRSTAQTSGRSTVQQHFDCIPSTDPNLELPASRAEECVLLTTSQV